MWENKFQNRQSKAEIIISSKKTVLSSLTDIHFIVFIFARLPAGEINLKT